VAPGASGGPTAGPTLEPGTSPEPGSSPVAGAGTGEERPIARDELWVLVVLIVLAVLMAEWLVYHRDAVTRLWRGLRRTPGAG
jgi:hypothetical protein